MSGESEDPLRPMKKQIMPEKSQTLSAKSCLEISSFYSSVFMNKIFMFRTNHILLLQIISIGRSRIMPEGQKEYSQKSVTKRICMDGCTRWGEKHKNSQEIVPKGREGIARGDNPWENKTLQNTAPKG